MKTLNKQLKYKFTWPKFTFAERMSLLGYARYMGYEFDYNPNKKKAVLIKNTDDGRKVLFLQKIDGKIIGVTKSGEHQILNPEMFLSKLLFNAGIFKIPEEDMDLNTFMKQNLELLA